MMNENRRIFYCIKSATHGETHITAGNWYYATKNNDTKKRTILTLNNQELSFQLEGKDFYDHFQLGNKKLLKAWLSEVRGRKLETKNAIFKIIKAEYQRQVKIVAAEYERTKDFTRLDSLNFNTRITNVFERKKIWYAEDLCEYTEKQVSKFKSIGDKSLKQIKRKLLEIGLSLKVHEEKK